MTQAPLALTFYYPMNDPYGKLFFNWYFSNTSLVGIAVCTQYTLVNEKKTIPFFQSIEFSGEI